MAIFIENLFIFIFSDAKDIEHLKIKKNELSESIKLEETEKQQVNTIIIKELFSFIWNVHQKEISLTSSQI